MKFCSCFPIPSLKKRKKKAFILFVRSFIDKYGYFLHDLGALGESKSAESQYTAVQMLEVQSSILNLIGLLSRYVYSLKEESEPESLQPTIQPSHLNLAHEAAYWIEKRALENMSISELANQLNVDRSHLTNSFKKVYGQSPRHYLTQVRIRRAKAMLMDTDWTMEKIAEELHFSSPSHFVKFFHKAVGLTPLKFRNQLQPE